MASSALNRPSPETTRETRERDCSDQGMGKENLEEVPDLACQHKINRKTLLHISTSPTVQKKGGGGLRAPTWHPPDTLALALRQSRDRCLPEPFPKVPDAQQKRFPELQLTEQKQFCSCPKCITFGQSSVLEPGFHAATTP